MIPAERQQRIREALDARGMVSIAEMAENLGVSQMTLRRDMQALERQGYAVLVSGGAQKTGRIAFELPQVEKRRLQYAEKTAIARKAVSLIRPGAAVYFDAGTTCLAIAEALTQQSELGDTILAISNDFTVVTHLMLHSDCRLYHTGGEVLRDNKSCVGETTANVISRLNLDLAFLSTSSWNSEWVSTPSESKIAVKIAAVRASQRSILVSDSTKYGKVGFFNIIKLQELDGIITDTGLPLAVQEQMVRSGINLMLVEPSAAAGPGEVQEQA
ncbi:DeoR/GlpR family DNA-binding transcription regulator [Oleispirillum naphthae]|uniref:DeoR/GlpR family DNA-binding transcription regulator n=1 Tax=Oleispirillum naphthae TaxID=2838853 RepID=UPI0030825CF7